MISLNYFLLIAALLFSIGLAIVITKRNAILLLMGIELMMNAVNINLVAFNQTDPQRFQGQLFSIFLIVVAAAEVTVGLAIIIKVYHYFNTIAMDNVKELKN